MGLFTFEQEKSCSTDHPFFIILLIQNEFFKKVQIIYYPLTLLKNLARAGKDLNSFPHKRYEMGNLAWSIGIFIIATFTKAWEPLSVALSQQRVPPFPFSALLVLCETSKLIATMPIIWHGGGCVAVASLFSRESAAMLAPPAALLAVCNFGLGYAVPRLDPMSYQVVFKAVSVCATALFSRLLLRRTLGWIRYAALAFLIVGAHLCSESPSHQSLRITSYEWRAGLGALLCGACALALSTVWFERVVMEQSDSAVHHTTAMALWGLAFNVIVLCTVGVSDAPQLSHADIFAAFSIAAADLSMSGFLALHGSNAYSSLTRARSARLDRNRCDFFRSYSHAAVWHRSFRCRRKRMGISRGRRLHAYSPASQGGLRVRRPGSSAFR